MTSTSEGENHAREWTTRPEKRSSSSSLSAMESSFVPKSTTGRTLTSIGFMKLPREIRDRLYYYIVTNGDIKVEYQILPAYRWEYDLRGLHTIIAPKYGPLRKVSYPTCSPQGIGGLPTCFNILFTNRKVSDEAIQVLYGEQVFSVPYEQAEAFRSNFVPSIGQLNTSYLRNISMTLPECLKSDSTMMSPYYTELFNKMPKLKRVVIGTHFYAHTSSGRIASEYSSILLFSARVATAHPRLKSATFLDMGLREAIQMRNDPSLPRSAILTAQIEIKIRITARTTQEELAVLLKHGGLMLDTQKICATTSNAMYKRWDPKYWALDCGEAIEVLTTIPRADEAMVRAAEKELEDEEANKKKSAKMETAKKIIGCKWPSGSSTVKKFKNSARLSQPSDNSNPEALSHQSDESNKDVTTFRFSHASAQTVGNDNKITGADSEDTKTTDARPSSSPELFPGASSDSTVLDSESQMVAQAFGLTPEDIREQHEIFEMNKAVKASVAEAVGKDAMAAIERTESDAGTCSMPETLSTQAQRLSSRYASGVDNSTSEDFRFLTGFLIGDRRQDNNESQRAEPDAMDLDTTIPSEKADDESKPSGRLTRLRSRQEEPQGRKMSTSQEPLHHGFPSLPSSSGFVLNRSPANLPGFGNSSETVAANHLSQVQQRSPFLGQSDSGRNQLCDILGLAPRTTRAVKKRVGLRTPTTLELAGVPSLRCGKYDQVVEPSEPVPTASSLPLPSPSPPPPTPPFITLMVRVPDLPGIPTLSPGTVGRHELLIHQQGLKIMFGKGGASEESKPIRLDDWLSLPHWRKQSKRADSSRKNGRDKQGGNAPRWEMYGPDQLENEGDVEDEDVVMDLGQDENDDEN